MIVTCERCATQFQLDDARIPPDGVRVRCSRCKHAFEIRLPEPGAPDPPPAPHDGHGDDEESDWEFNEDLPGGEAEPDGIGRDAATSVVDQLLADADALAAPPPSPPPAAPEPTHGFGVSSAPSGLELQDDPDPEPAPAEPDPAPAPEVAAPPPEAPAADLASEAVPATQPAPEPPGPVGGTRELDLSALDPGDPGSGDELESPSDWDLLAGDDDPGEAQPSPPPADEPDFGASSGLDPAAIQVDAELVDDRPAWQSGLSRAGSVVGWLVVCALFGYGLAGGLFPTTRADPQAVLRVAEDLEVRELAGRFVDHAAAGSIYVVSGKLHHVGSSPAPLPPLSVELFTATGGSVSAAAPLALPRSTRDLREAEPGPLAAGRPLAAAQRSLRPGEVRPFEAVVGPVPNTAVGFRLVAGEPARDAEAVGVTPAASARESGTPGPGAPSAAALAGEPESASPPVPPAAPAP